MRPFRATVAWRCDRIRVRLHVLPSAPFPDGSAVLGLFHQVVAVDLVGIMLGPRQAASYTHGDVRWKLGGTEQQHVAVAEQQPVMVMVRLFDFPKHLAVPIRFHRGATHVRLLANPGVISDLTVVEQRPFLR